MRTCDHSGRVLSHVLMAAVIVGPITAATSLAGPSAVPPDDLATRVNDALGLRASHIENLIIDETPGQPVIGFVSIEGTLQVLHLEPYSVRSDNYQLLVQEADGQIRAYTPGPVRTLRGSLLGVEGSVVAGSMLDDGLHARIVFPSGSEFWLEPLAGRVAQTGDGAYVVYRTEDVLPTNRTCALDALQQPFRAEAPLAEVGSTNDGDPLGAGGLCTAELACDADFEYFQAYGSVAAVEARINSVINTVNLQYEGEVGITHVLTTIIVRTAEPDPYSSTDAVTLLNQFRNHWLANHGNIQRDTAQLFTGKDIDSNVIGIAWLNVICTSYGFSVVQSDYNGNFSCATDLTAHELGHNWGANHCSCSGYTMNAFITCANQFHPTFTIPEIIAFRDSRTCIDCAPLPPTGACCVGTSCSIETEADCTAIGGGWQGAGTDCLPNPCNGELINLATADYATDSGAISGGSYLDTQAQDDVSEGLREQHTGGPPSNRRSLLSHTWTFNVAPGASYSFYVDAFHTANNEGDDFAFSYSLDDLNYEPMLTVIKTADDDALQSFAFIEDIAGVVFVRVEDTDRTPGNSVRDTIFVDEMFIVTATEGGDITPPSAPTGLTAIGGDESVTLDWLDNTEPDLGGYNVYRSTTSGGPYDLIAALLVPTTDYVDAAVINYTTYFYVVTAVDFSNNESTDSDEAPATPQPPGGPATTMHVDSIVLSIQNAGGGNKHGRADVTIVDNFGNPVAAALVTGTFSGDYNETQFATTNISGVATIMTTDTARGNPSFTFCVDDVAEVPLNYNPAANVETCDTR